MEEIATLVGQNVSLANDTAKLSGELGQTAEDMRKLIGTFELLKAEQTITSGRDKKKDVELF